MARRRRRKSNPPWWTEIDWSIHPDTLREIAAVGLVVTGVILLLALFGAGGGAGEAILNFFRTIVGFVGSIVGLVMVGLGVALWFPNRFPVKPMSVVGIALVLLVLPALVPTYGGLVGGAIADTLIALVGEIGAVVVVLGLVAIGVVLAGSVSIGQWLRNLTEREATEPEPTVNDATGSTKVSVFQTVQRRLSGNRAAGVTEGATVLRSLPGRDDWQFPPLGLLVSATTKASPGNVPKNIEVIGKTLKDFGIEVTMGDVNIGPTVTQYTLKPAEGIKLNQITARANDLALALAAHPIRIEAPIPGKAAVGIEVPNKIAATVTLREMLETDIFKESASPLTLTLGRDAAGVPMVADLAEMPHLLIAGATGSGKSIAINAIVTTLLYRNTPAELRLLLVDPKRVEFTPYNDLPHLLSPVIVEPDKTVSALKWALAEMDRRFRLLQEAGSRDIKSYNGSSAGRDRLLPYILVVIDELADLMQQSAKEVEGAIVRIAQLARAVGIHLIVATQRPSVDVITGLIKANITTRIAFAVASQTDSRTIIDLAGAEKLLGKGDMLLLSAKFGKPKRIQGALVTEKEVKAVTDFLKARTEPQYEENLLNFQPKGGGGVAGDGEIDDDLYTDAKQLVLDAGKASASLLQRRLRVGYARAARLLDLLEEQGVVGPADGARPRDVYADGGGGGYGDHDFPTVPASDIRRDNPKRDE